MSLLSMKDDEKILLIFQNNFQNDTKDINNYPKNEETKEVDAAKWKKRGF